MNILPIRINGINTARKLRLPASPDLLYYLPKQNVSSVFMSSSKKFYSSKKSTTSVVSKDFKGFLPSNYTDEFNSKNTILSQADYDPSVDNALAVNGNGITCFFIENEGSDPSSYGLSFDIPYKLSETPNVNNLIVFNITLGSSLIVSIVYESFYIDTIVIVKHPLLSEYLTTVLPNLDSELSL